jgi:hypothetical protein
MMVVFRRLKYIMGGRPVSGMGCAAGRYALTVGSLSRGPTRMTLVVARLCAQAQFCRQR